MDKPEYKGTYKDKQIAIKVLQNVDYKCFAHELVIIAYLEHLNIPKFYGIVIEPNILSLVFEFIDGKNLDEFKPSDFSNKLVYVKLIIKIKFIQLFKINKIIPNEY